MIKKSTINELCKIVITYPDLKKQNSQFWDSDILFLSVGTQSHEFGSSLKYTLELRISSVNEN